MKPYYRKLFLPLVALLFPAAVLAAPSGTLVIAENETPENLDPANSQNSTVDQLMIGIYDTLVQFTAGETTVTPRIATDWSVSDDGMAYTFNLRSDATFHDGSKLTAEDVKFTFDRAQAAGANALNDAGPYQSADIIDDYTIRLNLSAPFGPFVSALSRVFIINKDLVEPHMGDNNARTWLSVNEAGSGPYTVTTFKPTEEVVLTAYEPYWGGWDGNHVAEVVFRYIFEPSTQLALLKSGEIHIAPDITVDDKVALQGKSGYTIDVGAAATPLYYMMNTRKEGPLSNKTFRKALVMAFDTKLHLDTVLQGFGSVPDGPLPSNWPGHVSGTMASFDLDGAKKIIDENGWAGTEVTLSYLPADESQVRSAEQWQSNLRKIGVTLNTVGTTWPAMAATTRNLDETCDICANYSFPPFPDPHAILNGIFHSKKTGLNGGSNWHQYENPEVDKRLDKAASSSDPAERAELYGQIQKIMGPEHVHLVVTNGGSVVALSDKVEGYVYNVAHHQTFNYMDIGLK